ncbi:hypothetical protein BGZ70_008641 [Mortierella alpina]|uniref:Polysaccharide lyase 14 domain-containing protein n=1 Tax=Mortierella alpina TaxID=64518 RepID=A0A9P6M1H6_MORAP|nr:hypothetical protein BGZ70_008641 [Mortierella alpina]
MHCWNIAFALQATLLLVYTSCCTVTAQQQKPNITITIGASGSANKIYHWEFNLFPLSVAELQRPLQLSAPLKPGRDTFDIKPDPQKAARKGLKASASKIASRVLRSLYPAHSYARSKDRHPSFVSTPLPKEAFSGGTSRYIRLEYQMFFKPGFKWVKGGKLPGILLGSEKGCNAGCSGGGSAEGCFSTRMMWRKDGMGELYLYAAKSVYFPKQPAEICKRSLDKRSPEALFWLEKRQIDQFMIPEDDEYDDEVKADGFRTLTKRADNSCLDGVRLKISPGARNHCNPAYGISIGRGGAFRFKSGQWHNVTQIVRVNSKGKAVKDGYLSVYLDNKPVVQADGLVLLKNGYDPKRGAAMQVKFMFSSFFGGHTSDYATPIAQWIAWKGFKMTTSSKNLWE